MKKRYHWRYIFGIAGILILAIECFYLFNKLDENLTSFEAGALIITICLSIILFIDMVLTIELFIDWLIKKIESWTQNKSK